MPITAIRSFRRAVWAAVLLLGSATVATPGRVSAQVLEHSTQSTTAGPVLPRHFASSPRALNTAVAKRAASSAGAVIYISTAAIVIGAILLVVLLL